MTAQTILPANTLSSGSYDVDNSVRFNDGDSDHLLIVPSSASNKQTWTWSAWVKRGVLGTRQVLFSGYDQAAGLGESIEFTSGDLLEYDLDIAGTDFTVTSSRVFRDVTAWYHILFIKDVTESTETNRIKVYVNGVLIDLVENANGYPAENATNGLINTAGNYEHHVGCLVPNSSFFDGYMCEVVFIDGTAQTNTDFGEFDSDSGIWKPIDVSGLTFGTNGFYLEFKGSGTSANSSGIGADTSGNDHHFTVTNLTAVDQSTDTCTNNFATFNGNLSYNSTIALAEGNLKGTTGSTHEARTQSIFSSIGVTQGKWYAEFKVTTNSNHSLVGISADMESDADGSSGSAYSFIYLGQGLGYYGSNGKIFHTNSDTQMTYGSAVSNNDIIGVALDADNQEVYFSINGTFQNSGNPASGSSKTGGVVNEGARNIFSTGTGTLFFVVADHDRDATCAIEANFGGGSVSSISSGNSDANGYGNFEYSVPSGYYSLCTKNLAEYG